MYKYLCIVSVFLLFLGQTLIANTREYSSMIGVTGSILSSYTRIDVGRSDDVIIAIGPFMGFEHYSDFAKQPLFGIRSSAVFGIPLDGGVGSGQYYTRVYPDSDYVLFYRSALGLSVRPINWRRWQVRVSPSVGVELLHVKWPAISVTNYQFHETREFVVTSAQVLAITDIISTFRVTKRFVSFVGLDLGFPVYSRTRIRFTENDEVYSGSPLYARLFTLDSIQSARIYLGIGRLL